MGWIGRQQSYVAREVGAYSLEARQLAPRDDSALGESPAGLEAVSAVDGVVGEVSRRGNSDKQNTGSLPEKPHLPLGHPDTLHCGPDTRRGHADI